MFNKNFGYAPAIIAPKLLQTFIILYLSKVLGVENYAIYSLIVVYGEFVDSLVMRWARSFYIRFKRSKESLYLQKEISNSYLLSILLGSVVILLIFILDKNTQSLKFVLLLFLYFIVNAFYSLILSELRLLNKRSLYVKFEILRSVLATLFLVLLHLLELVSITTISLTVSLVIIINIFFLKEYLPFSIFKIDMNINFRKDIYRYALPLIPFYLLYQVTMVTDRYLIGQFINLEALGIYAFAYTLSRPVIDVIFNALNLATYTNIVDIYEQQDIKKVKDIFNNKIVLLLNILLPIFVIATLCGKEIAERFLSREMENIEYLIPLLMASFIIIGFKNFVFDQIFHLGKSSKLHTTTLLPGIFINITLNLLLLQKFGILVAGVSLLISSSIGLILSILKSRKIIRVGIPILKIVMPIIFCALFIIFSVSVKKYFNIYIYVAVNILICLLTSVILLSFQKRNKI